MSCSGRRVLNFHLDMKTRLIFRWFLLFRGDYPGGSLGAEIPNGPLK